MNFVFISPNFHLNCGSSIKTVSFRCATLDKVEVWNLVWDIKTKFIKVAMFKRQAFCSGFKCKSHESS